MTAADRNHTRRPPSVCSDSEMSLKRGFGHGWGFGAGLLLGSSVAAGCGARNDRTVRRSPRGFLILFLTRRRHRPPASLPNCRPRVAGTALAASTAEVAPAVLSVCSMVTPA